MGKFKNLHLLIIYKYLSYNNNHENVYRFTVRGDKRLTFGYRERRDRERVREREKERESNLPLSRSRQYHPLPNGMVKNHDL